MTGMRILVLGGDGYLGWPTAMHLSIAGHDVAVLDSGFKRVLCSRYKRKPLLCPPLMGERVDRFNAQTTREIRCYSADCSSFAELSGVVREETPDAIVHFAEQPSGPWSMIGYDEAAKTLNNNLNTTLSLVWAVIKHAPNCHIVKLGTAGEYGTPNIDIEEGWIEIEHKGRKDTFLFPRQAGSFYHTTKILDTDLLWFYVRNYDLAVTDLMQGPVYGLVTKELEELHDENLGTFLYYDDIFGTVINRFLVQAMCGVPLTVYGKGGQTRGYLNLIDTVNCVRLACENPADLGELRIMNQFTEQFSVRDIAERVQVAGKELGLDVAVQTVENPRKEAEEHYYNMAFQKLPDLGLQPTLLTPERLVQMMKAIRPHLRFVDKSQILPRVRWSGR